MHAGKLPKNRSSDKTGLCCLLRVLTWDKSVNPADLLSRRELALSRPCVTCESCCLIIALLSAATADVPLSLSVSCPCIADSATIRHLGLSNIRDSLPACLPLKYLKRPGARFKETRSLWETRKSHSKFLRPGVDHVTRNSFLIFSLCHWRQYYGINPVDSNPFNFSFRLPGESESRRCTRCADSWS